MSYTALYRKFRPEDFDGVKGQDHIVTTLKNQIISGKTSHAYLFCGTRGTGKTSVAKIFAKAVNCMNPKNGSPCNECEACRSISAGISMNVTEIDAASNNSVENIREIREEVKYSPVGGKYKVYIIDEVHMLSSGAFNALLKTLEEPPSYVIFILATTESHKIPVTILSRCQRYDFKRLNVNTITEWLKELTSVERMEIEERALRYIAVKADGAMRDALSLLDRCAAFYMGQTMKYENVLDVLGAVDMEVFSRLMRMVIASDAIGCIRILNEIIMNGGDVSRFIEDFTLYMRNMMLVMTSSDSDGISDMLDMSGESMEALRKETALVNVDDIMRYIRIFSELSGRIKYASNKRVIIEIALIKLTKPAMETDLSSVLQRISQLETKLEKAVSISNQNSRGNAREDTGEDVAAGGADNADGVNTDGINADNADTVGVGADRKPASPVPEDIRKIADNWYRIESKLGGRIRPYFKNVRFSVGSDPDELNKLIIVCDNDLSYKTLSEPERVKEMESAAAEHIGKNVCIIVKKMSNNDEYIDKYTEIRKKINFPMNEEE